MSTAPPLRLLVVVPSAEDTAATRRALDLSRQLAGLPDVDLTVLVWMSGPLGDEFATVAPTVDAGAVNQWRPAQLLARARLGPAARLAKNRRLRAVLAPLQSVDAVLVVGLGGVAALAWLPGRPSAVAVTIRASDTATATVEVDLAALRTVPLLVACDPVADRWLATTVGAGPTQIRRHGLLDGPEAPSGDGGRIGLVGWSADEVARIIAALAAEGPGTGFTWFVEERQAWGLWQGPTASPLARQVELVPPEGRTTDLAALRLLLVGEGGPAAVDLAAAAGLFGAATVEAGPRAVDAAVTKARVAADAGVAPTQPWTFSAAQGAQALSEALVGLAAKAGGAGPGGSTSGAGGPPRARGPAAG